MYSYLCYLFGMVKTKTRLMIMLLKIDNLKRQLPLTINDKGKTITLSKISSKDKQVSYLGFLHCWLKANFLCLFNVFQSFFILRDHTFVTSTWKRDGEDLKNLSRVCGFFCFQKIDLLFIFADEVGGRGSRSFCVDVINLWPLSSA